MDKYPLLMKGLTVGIILLFVATAIIPSTAQNREKPSLPTSSGHWLYVGGSGPGNYSRIQDAINDSHDGNTVFVFHGRYNEHIVVNNAIYLIGENKNTTTIINNVDGNASDAVTIRSGNVTVMGFTVIGGVSPYAIGLGGYATIKSNVIKATFGMDVGSSFNSILFNNITGFGLPGAGIGCAIDRILSNNRLENNCIFSPVWIGISVEGNSNIINHNLIVASGLSDLYGSKNMLSNNTFQTSGLRCYSSTGNIVVNNTVNGKPLVFLGNTSNRVIDSDAGQIILIQCKNITITNQNLSHSPLGIQVVGSTHCQINNNTISYCSDAGIAIYYSDTIMVMDNTIEESTIQIGQWDFGYNNNIIVSRNTYRLGELGSFEISICNTNNCTLSYNNLVNTILELAFYDRNCQICCNNFLKSSYIFIEVGHFPHIRFNRNYWERPRFFPKFNFGITEIFGGDHPEQVLPWLFIDWHPRLIPYVIS